LIQNSFLLAALFYLLSFFATLANKKNLTAVLLVGGLLANLCSVYFRCRQAWPMLPLYQAPFFLPLFFGVISVKVAWKDHATRKNILLILSGLSWLAAFFPNDHYLPFLHFKSILAHLFFLFGITGRAFFLLSGILAWQILKQRKEEGSEGFTLKDVRRSVIWGYFFLTLSIFSGAIWSYLGWGLPIVWDDPAITTAMAAWLYYSLYLHLHLISFTTVKSRPWFALFGAVWVTVFSWLPDMGRFMVPIIFIY